VRSRETTFLDKAWVLTLTSCFFLIHKKGHLITDPQKIYPKSESKMDTKNHEKKKKKKKKKAILVLQRVNFYFQNTWQSKDCIYRITCVRSLIKKLDFQKVFSKKDISDFISTNYTLNRHDLRNMRVDSKTRKIIGHKRTSIESAKSLIEMTLKSSTLLEKLSSWGAIQWTRRRKNKQYLDQLWGNERWLNDELVNWRKWYSKSMNKHI